MNLKRRSFVQGAAALLTPVISQHVSAQPTTWPRSTVRLIVPFAPGGGTDVATRLLAERLRAMWDVSVVVENKTGGNTVIAAESVVNGPRDGSVFLATIPLTMQLPYLTSKMSFNPATDLVPVTPVMLEQLVLVIGAGQKMKSLADVLQAGKAGGPAMTYGSYGTGSNSHLLMIELAKAAGTEIVHVPYRGAAPAVQAVLSGEVTMALSNYGAVRQHIAAGKLIAIGVTGNRRDRVLPDVPTMMEHGVRGFEIPAWLGVFAAKGVSSEITRKLEADIQTAIRSPEILARFHDAGQEAGQMSNDEFRELIRRDNENNERMIRASGVRLD